MASLSCCSLKGIIANLVVFAGTNKHGILETTLQPSAAAAPSLITNEITEEKLLATVVETDIAATKLSSVCTSKIGRY